MNKLYKIACMMLTGVALLATTSCSDPDDEITTVNMDRLLRPTGLELKIVDKTNIKATMDFVSLPSYVDYTVEVNDNPLSEAKNWKPYRTGTMDFTTETKRDHRTVTTNITGLTYFKDYRVTFSSRDTNGKVSNTSSAIATTEGVFKENDDDDRTNTSITVKWANDVAATKVRTMKMNGATEELVSEDAITDATAAKFTKDGLAADTEYIFYLFDGDNCLGRTTFITFPNYQEFKAQDGFDLQGAIDNVTDGYAIMLSPDGENNVFNLAASTITINKTVRIMARDTKPVIVNKVAFDLVGSTGLTIENIKCVDAEKKNAFLKFSSPASGNYVISGVELEGYKNFAQDPGTTATELNLLEVKNCFMHNGISGRWMDFQKKMCWIHKINIVQSTFAEICNGQDFLRYDYYAGKMPDLITLDHCSFYKVNATSKGIMYVRSNAADTKEFKAEIKNCVFESCKDAAGVYFSEDAKTNGLSFSKNYYKDSDKLLEAYAAGQTAYDPSPLTYTGKSAFKDPDAGDFTITNKTLVDAGAGNSEFEK